MVTCVRKSCLSLAVLAGLWSSTLPATAGADEGYSFASDVETLEEAAAGAAAPQTDEIIEVPDGEPVYEGEGMPTEMGEGMYDEYAEGCEGCGECTGDAGCCCEDCVQAPKFYMAGESLWLQRDGGRNLTLGTNVTRAGAPAGDNRFELRSLQGFDQQPGPRITIGRRISQRTAIEGSYFGLQFWSDAHTQTPSDGSFGLQSPLLGSTSFAPDAFNQSLSARFTSEIQNGEINFRTFLTNDYRSRVSVLVGARYLSWRERVSLFGNNTPNVGQNESTIVSTFNNLVGMQIGAESRHFWHREQCSWLFHTLGLGMSGKAGIYGNAAAVRTQNGGTGTMDGNLLDVRRFGGQLSTVVDASVFASVSVGRRSSIYGGYQALYIAGLALAPENMQQLGNSIQSADPVTPIAAGTGRSIHRTSDMFLHGPYVGGEVRF